MAEEKLYNITLIESKMLTSDVLELRFAKPDGFDFLAGQFVQFKVPEHKKFVFRSYSISSDPSKYYLEFLVKILSGGLASEMFANLKKGESASISIAKGVFWLKSEYTVKKIFIATGVGIAPIASMIDTLSPLENIKLLFGVRSEADLFWQERLNRINAEPNFDVKITLSQPSEKWDGLTGRVTQYLPIDIEADYYICGNLPMVKFVRAALMDRQIKTERVHFEIF